MDRRVPVMAGLGDGMRITGRESSLGGRVKERKEHGITRAEKLKKKKDK